MNLGLQKRLQELLRARAAGYADTVPGASGVGDNWQWDDLPTGRLEITRRICFCIHMGSREDATPDQIDLAARLSHAIKPFPVLGPIEA